MTEGNAGSRFGMASSFSWGPTKKASSSRNTSGGAARQVLEPPRQHLSSGGSPSGRDWRELHRQSAQSPGRSHDDPTNQEQLLVDGKTAEHVETEGCSDELRRGDGSRLIAPARTRSPPVIRARS